MLRVFAGVGIAHGRLKFQDRLKRRGQFWSLRGLANMLTVDVAVKNDTLQFLWN